MMNYNPSMITLARESRGLTQTELAEKVGLPQGTISKLESGALLFSDELARDFALALSYPASFFTQPDQVYPFGSSTFYHRKLQSAPASTLRKLEARINIYRANIVRLLRSTNLDSRCRFRRSDASEHEGRIEEIASLTRASWHLPPGPVPNLIRLLEDAGAVVIRFDFGTSKMSGLSEWLPPAPPLFFLNDNPAITADRDRFTLAHELGHVILHDLPSINMEDEANRFAAEFLMPERDIRPQLISPVKLHTVARLKPFWKVSMASLIQRSRDLGIINDNQFVYLRMQLQQKGYRYREPAELDIEREQPSLLREIINAHMGELGYSAEELAASVHLAPSEFNDYYEVNNSDNRGLKIVRRA